MGNAECSLPLSCFLDRIPSPPHMPITVLTPARQPREKYFPLLPEPLVNPIETLE